MCVEGGRGGVMWAWEEAMSENERKKRKKRRKKTGLFWNEEVQWGEGGQGEDLGKRER